jgi:ABC-2 type transport system permease protein
VRRYADILVINDDTDTSSSSLVQEIGSFIPKYGDPKMFSITYTKDMGQSKAERKIDAGLYKAVLIIPQDYSERVAKNEGVTLTLLTDSSDTTSSGIIINFMRQLISKTGNISLDIPDIYGKLQYIDACGHCPLQCSSVLSRPWVML